MNDHCIPLLFFCLIPRMERVGYSEQYAQAAFIGKTIPVGDADHWSGLQSSRWKLMAAGLCRKMNRSLSGPDSRAIYLLRLQVSSLCSKQTGWQIYLGEKHCVSCFWHLEAYVCFCQKVGSQHHLTWHS